MPATVTVELLNSECPLRPEKKIKDTHLLVLVPKIVNGEPYSALKLDKLCATRKGSGDRLIYDEAKYWKGHQWASKPQAESEWVLLPKSDPHPQRTPEAKHFRHKRIAEQQKVHEEHYQEYREAKAVELMTAALLNELVNGKPRMLGTFKYLRCVEPTADGGRVCVGSFVAAGLEILDTFADRDEVFLGRALTRKL
jgi:hypothetical protein